MPLYEYRCKKCGKTSSFLEKAGEKKLFGRKCRHCKKRALEKVISSFSTQRNLSYNDTLNEISKMAPINFVPQAPRPKGPWEVPGGCPYENAAKQEAAEKKAKERPRAIEL